MIFKEDLSTLSSCEKRASGREKSQCKGPETEISWGIERPVTITINMVTKTWGYKGGLKEDKGQRTQDFTGYGKNLNLF